MAYDPEAHRARIVAAKQKSIEDYDKAIMTLSAGALGLSLTFIKDIAPKPVLLGGVILATWICWLISLSLTVISFYFAKRACEAAIGQLDIVIEQLDKPDFGLPEKESDAEEHLGEKWDKATKIINVMSGVLFFIGVICFIIFVFTNLQCNNEQSKTRPEANPKSAPALSITPAP